MLEHETAFLSSSIYIIKSILDLRANPTVCHKYPPSAIAECQRSRSGYCDLTHPEGLHGVSRISSQCKVTGLCRSDRSHSLKRPANITTHPSNPGILIACECATLGIDVNKYLHDDLAKVVPESNIVICVELGAEGVTCPLNDPSHINIGLRSFGSNILRELGAEQVHELPCNLTVGDGVEPGQWLGHRGSVVPGLVRSYRVWRQVGQWLALELSDESDSFKQASLKTWFQ